MSRGLIAKASVSITVPIAKVWDALINPEIIRQYMFGTEAVSEWSEGSTVVWKGVWEGKPYEDKGVILKMEKEKKFEYSHFSPLAGLPDVPENYHILTYDLSVRGNATFVSLSQDNNSTEKAQKHSKNMWECLLSDLKMILEK